MYTVKVCVNIWSAMLDQVRTAVTKSGTGTWDLGRGTRERGTQGRGDAGRRDVGRGDLRTRGRRDVGLGDAGTWDSKMLGPGMWHVGT